MVKRKVGSYLDNEPGRVATRFELDAEDLVADSGSGVVSNCPNEAGLSTWLPNILVTTGSADVARW